MTYANQRDKSGADLADDLAFDGDGCVGDSLKQNAHGIFDFLVDQSIPSLTA
jgi:hypothetical protein